MIYQHVQIPSDGQKIEIDEKGGLNVPDQPIIPFIQGDGIGVDITPAMQLVVDNAVKMAYQGQKQIHWMEVYTGEKAAELYQGDWFPAETLQAIKDFVVAIKGPLTTPIGGGFRSLSIALRQELDLFVCLRPIRWFTGVPSPLKEPEKTDVVVFRENSEDIYSGVEWKAGSIQAERMISFLTQEMGVNKLRFTDELGLGIKPISKEGSQRLIRAAIQYAITHNRASVTIVHKGNMMKFTEGAFKQWGYEVAKNEFGAQVGSDGFTLEITNPNTQKSIVINDMITDTMLQQVLLKPEQFDVIATMNMNGDYLADSITAQVGGVGIAPGANLGADVALFEVTHGSAPKYAGLNKVNPGSLILSAEMMLRHLGWADAADLVIKGMNNAIENQTVTYDLAQDLNEAKVIGTQEFAQAIVKGMS